MKILRIVYDWPEPWAGLSPHPYELTVSQANMGHDIIVFAGRWPRSGVMQEPKGVMVKGFLREPLKGTLSLTSSVALFFYYLRWRMSNRPDLIHAHGHFAIWIYLYRLFLKSIFKGSDELKIPLVVHFHNTVEGRKEKLKSSGKSIDPISSFLAWPLASMSDRWAAKVADALVFVGEDLKQEAEKYYNVDVSKSFVIESGVNGYLFRPVGGEEKEKTRRDLGLDRLDSVIINFGMMVDRKNIDKLVLSLKYLPDTYKLLLIGPGNVDYLSDIDQLIRNNQLNTRVIRGGYTPYPQAPIALQAADIFVLPSEFEGTPKVVMESLSCGVPVLASGFRLSQEISGLMYLDDTSPEYIAQRIVEVLESDIQVDRGKVHFMYSWDNRAEELEKVYAYAKEGLAKQKVIREKDY